MTSPKPSDLVQTISFDAFIKGLRKELQRSMDALVQELDSATARALPVFLIDEVELTVGCVVETTATGKMTGSADSGGILKVLVGKLTVGADVELARQKQITGNLKVRMKPRGAYRDADGWHLDSDVYLSRPDAGPSDFSRARPKKTGAKGRQA